MAFTHQITTNWQRGNDQFSKAVSKSADGEINRSIAVADGQTALLVSLALDVSEVKSLVIVADKAMTLKTNSSSVPDDTIALVAGEPYVWWDGSPATCLLTVDVTALYVANASGDDGTLEIRALQDSTP
ncbi:MAG: hypothetical protein A3E01_10780 [Gammaproteobacteria bacterium RIFCSPHIGHO2_12_FULL_63_22]|nr:MAG: hypothetical protein A3E01_10780 [Gammaproteobacteria bacterium RIFCSPHIGHO2_12_FULL_63_22]